MQVWWLRAEIASQGRSNVAPTFLTPSIVTTHCAASPLQAPLQPWKVEPGAAVALSVTTVPGASLATQADGHEMPAGLELMLPEPLGVTRSLNGFGLPAFAACVPASAASAASANAASRLIRPRVPPASVMWISSRAWAPP